MEIRIITTGGTIDGLEYDDELNKPNVLDNRVVQFFKMANLQFKYTFDHAFFKDSRFITSKDREKLKTKINSYTEDKVLITHGTLTMIQTAEFLGQLKLNKTIVLTGSFILGSKPDTDAPFNLGYAIHALQTLSKGVYIAMNGMVFSYDNVFKNEDSNRFETKS